MSSKKYGKIITKFNKMSGEIEYGTCDMCKKEAHINRKYYRYDIKCDCCNSKDKPHFEIVRYCNECEPKPPRKVNVSLEPIE